MITLPGLIDPHVHTRYLSSSKKMFFTGSNVGIASGYTTVLDMPNNTPPITTLLRLQQKMKLAKQHTKHDIGFYFGSLGDNLDEFNKVKNLVFGLKLFLNTTTGGYLIDIPTTKIIYKKWLEVTSGKRPILLHAEDETLDSVAKIVAETKQPTHITHVSSKNELHKILKMKDKGLPVTCGVTPHHLFLTQDDLTVLGTYGLMKPELKSKIDQQFLWKHFDDIDVIESDHASHTRVSKESKNPPYGVPVLEATLPLLLTAMHKGKITKDDIIDKCFTRVKEIFTIPDQKNTYIEVDENKEWIINNYALQTNSKWSPFNAWEVTGKIIKVVIRGKTALENGKFLVENDFGEVIIPEKIT